MKPTRDLLRFTRATTSNNLFTKSCCKPWGCCPRCQVASVLSLVKYKLSLGNFYGQKVRFLPLFRSFRTLDLTRRHSYLTKSCWKPWGCCPRCQVALVLNLVNFRNWLTQLRSCFGVVFSNSEVVATCDEQLRDLRPTTRDLRTTTFSVAALCCESPLLLLRSTAASFHCCSVRR